MNETERKLKSWIEFAVDSAGERYGKFRSRFCVDELFETVLHDDDSPALIAAKALEHLCGDEAGGFNGSTIGLKAVFQFLSDVSESGPTDEEDVRRCHGDLKAKGFKRESLLTWVETWYTFPA